MRFAKNIKIKTRKFFILCDFNLKSEKKMSIRIINIEDEKVKIGKQLWNF